MREANIIRMLTQVVSLAMVALALTVGSAFAHGNHDQVATQLQANDTERQPGDESSASGTSGSVMVMQADGAGPGDMPCSDDHQKTGSASGTCCTMACHAALAAMTIEPLGAHEPPSVRVVGLADMLEGRSGDRAERPPRLS